MVALRLMSILSYLHNLLNHKPLTAILVRRYKITSGNVGELYIDGKCIADTLDTYSDNASTIDAIAIYDDFIYLRKENKLVINNTDLENKRIHATVSNRWVSES